MIKYCGEKKTLCKTKKDIAILTMGMNKQGEAERKN